MDKEYARKIVKSWLCTEGTIYSNKELLTWIEERNKQIHVDIKQINLSDSDNWYMNETHHTICNRNGGFFSIQGLNVYENGEVLHSQPVILQDEIGYLGIITKEINGARSWFILGAFSFQPAEFAKIFVIMFLANIICIFQKNALNSLKFLPSSQIPL